MLVLKKMTVKKIAIYFAVICAMLGGTGFMLYQNYKLTNNQTGIVNMPANYNAAMTGGPAGGGAPTVAAPTAAVPLADTQPASAPGGKVAPTQPLDINKLKNNGGLDLTIFSNEKFKALKENAIAAGDQPETGKRDPFQPN